MTVLCLTVHILPLRIRTGGISSELIILSYLNCLIIQYRYYCTAQAVFHVFGIS